MEKIDSYQNGLPLVVFSGGVDSTYILAMAMEKHEFVDTMYVHIPLAGYKIVKERAQRLKIFEYLSKRYECIVSNDYFVDVSASFHIDKLKPSDTYINVGHLWGVDKLNFVQPPHWLFQAFIICDPERHSSVQMGYIKGDDVSLLVNELQALWKALWALGRPDKKIVPLEFPLLNYSKEDLVERLPSWGEELPDMVWYCENPMLKDKTTGESYRGGMEVTGDPDDIHACGTCRPCIRHARALYDPTMHDIVVKEGIDQPTINGIPKIDAEK